MKSALIIVLAGTSLVLAACNRAEPERSSSIPAGPRATALLADPHGELSAPPAPAERGASTFDAIASAAGTETGSVFASEKAARPLPPSKGGAPDDQAINVRAQEAAAKAPDTAAGDAARKKLVSEAAG
jgi:hypothetical protein